MHEAAWIDRRIQLTAIVASALCVAYLYSLDHVLVSSAHFAPIFRRLLTVEDLSSAWLALGICLLAAAWSRPAPILRVVDFFAEHPYLVAFASLILCALGAVSVYHDYPLSMDEYAAVLQAKIFASGHFCAQLPRDLVDWLVVRGFNGSFLVASPETGRAAGYYWPGFSLLLAPFEYLQAPWACNATLVGLAMLLVHWITREITGERRAAGWALLFTASSGAFAANAISYYSMQAHLTANLGFVALLLQPTRKRALGAGLLGSLALILHNPVPHVLFALPWIIGLAMARDKRRYLWPLLIGYLPGAAIGLVWIMFREDIASASHAGSMLHGVAAGVFAWPDAALMNMRTAALVKMWIWAVPCLFVFALLGHLRHPDNLHVRLLTQSAVLTFAGYLFVRFDQGHGWGYRYFHSAWGAIPILAGCAMAAKSDGALRADSRLISFVGAAAILNLVVMVPFQMHQISEFIAQHLAQLPPPQTPGNNVYFIHPRGGFYVADMVQFDPLLRDRDLKLVSHGAELDAELVRQNWPDAVKVAGAPAADQWWLGPSDQRRPIPGSEQRRFMFTLAGKEITPPSAADR